MVLSLSAWSGTEGAVCVSVLGLPQHPLRPTAEILFGNLLCAKESTHAFCSAWAGRCDLNEPLFSSKFCHFEGRKKMLQPTQPIRYGLENQHSLFSQETMERG